MWLRTKRGFSDILYRSGYAINRASSPRQRKISPARLANGRRWKMSHLLLSISFISGLCSQSSFSTSSGNKSKAELGRILYFSDTVWVLTFSSSVPVRDGDLESSNGDAKGPSARLSWLIEDSSLQLVLREGNSEASGEGLGDSSSRNLRMRERFGGNNKSEDSP